MENWKTVRLGDVCEKGSSNIAQNEITDNNGEYPIYGAAGFIKNVDFYKQDKPYIGIVKDGAGVGRVSVHPAKSSLIGTMQYIFPKENIDIKFLAEFLKYQNLSRFYTGATIPHIYFKDYQNIPLKLPPLQKQKHISAVLDKCTALIAKHKLMLEKYDTLIKSRFIEMFGDPVTNPMGWEVKKLKETAEIITGNTPSRKEKDNYGTHIEWIKTDNITNLTYVTTASESLSEIGEKLGRSVEAGAILMACIAGSLRSIGRVALTDRKVAFNQQINAIVPKQYNNLFLYVLFQNTQSYAQSNVNMALKGILSKGKLEELEYIVPPLELQNDFAAFVQQIDKSKFVVQKSLEKAETLYKSLMQEYFG